MEKEFNYEHRLTEVESSTKTNMNRLNDIIERMDAQKKDLDELISSVKILNFRLEENFRGDREVKADVKSLTSRSGKRWDNLVDKLVLGVVAAILGFILAKLGF